VNTIGPTSRNIRDASGIHQNTSIAWPAISRGRGHDAFRCTQKAKPLRDLNAECFTCASVGASVTGFPVGAHAIDMCLQRIDVDQLFAYRRSLMAWIVMRSRGVCTTAKPKMAYPCTLICANYLRREESGPTQLSISKTTKRTRQEEEKGRKAVAQNGTGQSAACGDNAAASCRRRVEVVDLGVALRHRLARVRQCESGDLPPSPLVRRE
jgi:hypothetical protein